MKKNYTQFYSGMTNKINLPMNIITRIFLSRFSPIKGNFYKKKILDFSCGTGPYLKLLQDLKFKVYASEISKKISQNLKKKFPKVSFKVSDNKKIDFEKNYFDYVLCHHSIYYLNSEDETFENTINEIRRVTKVGGVIICTFPTKNQYHLKFKKIKKQTFKIVYDKYGLRKGGYLYLFKNSKEIRNYFKKNFKILELGKQKVSFGKLNESFYIIILKKK